MVIRVRIISFDFLILNTMSIETSPLQRLFDLQRRYVERTKESIKKGIGAQNKAVKETDFEAPSSTLERNM